VCFQHVLGCLYGKEKGKIKSKEASKEKGSVLLLWTII
jgi:hypothetical protein